MVSTTIYFRVKLNEPTTKLAYSDNYLSVLLLVQCYVFLFDMVNKSLGWCWLWTVKTWLCTNDGKKEKVLWNPLHLSQNISHFSTENDFLSMLFAVLSTWNSRTNRMGRRPICLPNKILAASIANKVKSQKSLGFFYDALFFLPFNSFLFFIIVFHLSSFFFFVDCM